MNMASRTNSEHSVQVRERLAAATPAPWSASEEWAAISAGLDAVVHAYVDMRCPACDDHIHDDANVVLSVEDAELIAHAPTDLERLLRRAEAAEKRADLVGGAYAAKWAGEDHIESLTSALVSAHAQLSQVAELHRPLVRSAAEGQDVPVCSTCVQWSGTTAEPALWPCATARLLGLKAATSKESSTAEPFHETQVQRSAGNADEKVRGLPGRSHLAP